ncbi:MAG: nucleotidyltransferase domain-containing protein, partial [Candidatus Aenigmatarchaeota archaeon]
MAQYKEEKKGEMLWEEALDKKTEKKDDKPEKLGEKERIEILKKFTKGALERYGNVIRSIVLFGSTARKEYKSESDIDVFVILDDTKVNMTPELKEDIEWGLEDLAKGLSKQLSVQQPYLLTEFWALVREGHPIVFNFVREGLPIYDRDIFLPIKKLLQRGEI